VTEVHQPAHALLQTSGFYMWQWGLLLINRTPIAKHLIAYFKSSTKLARVFQTVSSATPGQLLTSAFPETKLQDRDTSTLSSDYAWVHTNLRVCFDVANKSLQPRRHLPSLRIQTRSYGSFKPIESTISAYQHVSVRTSFHLQQRNSQGLLYNVLVSP
jgi:hypothetical protein